MYKTSQCNPGQKWDASRPVKVKLLADSYFDFLENRSASSSLKDLVRIDSDIRAVIALYNDIPGNGLTLEMDTGISGDRNLEEPDVDNFGTQNIVIGFTDEVASSPSAEAWAPGNPADGCTRTRAHILFRKGASDYAPVTANVCPGDQVQLRYSLNNNSMYKDVQVKTEVWFSEDEILNARNGRDRASPDVREFTIKAGASAIIGQVFRLPANAPASKTLHVFARAIPYDTKTGEKLWNDDVDKWNKAILIRESIRAASSACT